MTHLLVTVLVRIGGISIQLLKLINNSLSLNKGNHDRDGEPKQDKTRQLYFTRVAQSAARLVSLGALGSIRFTYTHLQ